MKKHLISFAGAGRLAGNLCRELHISGYGIEMIVSKSEERGRPLATSCDAEWSDKLRFPDSTEIIFVAVPDKELKSVLDNIQCSRKAIVVHTAGSMGLDVFPEYIERKGVFYPLQTFSNDRKISFEKLPVFIEASDKISSRLLGKIVDSLGANKYFTDMENRRMLHLAAVFACNFSNHMLTQGKVLAQRSGFSFEELKPLVRETFLKALDLGPENSQTGPAFRNDVNTLAKHLELLSLDPDMEDIYTEISRSIIKHHLKL